MTIEDRLRLEREAKEAETNAKNRKDPDTGKFISAPPPSLGEGAGVKEVAQRIADKAHVGTCNLLSFSCLFRSSMDSHKLAYGKLAIPAHYGMIYRQLPAID